MWLCQNMNVKMVFLYAFYCFSVYRSSHRQHTLCIVGSDETMIHVRNICCICVPPRIFYRVRPIFVPLKSSFFFYDGVAVAEREKQRDSDRVTVRNRERKKNRTELQRDR